ncbi:glycosyltransferase [Pseudoxanthomonas sp. J35]|uniref:glycosyltransferase n=1 Tax=Pseudoxanthomonas sp. J35 TaxID=935852 RepID=UPI00048FB559|nr:glycosyltransferase [Pseudoxanthomonas sp. J35]
MFYVNEPQNEYRAPWTQRFDERFRALCSRGTRVAYFYEAADTSTFRYRAYNMACALMEGTMDVSSSYFFNSDADHFNEIVDVSNVIVVCRMRYNDKIAGMIARAKALGKRVLFDVDDLVFNVDYVQLILKTLAQDLKHPGAWDHWFAYISRIGAVARLCDESVTTNQYLARQLEAFTGRKARVVPNFMNKEQLAISDRIFEEKVASAFRRTDDIHIGYFSGTPTHNHDFSMVGTALERLLREDPRVKLLVVGFLDMSGDLAKYSERIQVYPLHDFINLQRVMSLVEINIVPLLDNVFTNCKSELKYFEAAAVGTLTVATPIHTYGSAIESGINGFLANSTGWYEEIKRAIEVVDQGYADMAKVARSRAIESYAWFNQMEKIREALFNGEQK